MGVDWIDPDVRPVIGGQTAAVVSQSGDYGQFLADFVPVCDEVRELKHSVETMLKQTMVAVERELNRTGQ